MIVGDVVGDVDNIEVVDVLDVVLEVLVELEVVVNSGVVEVDKVVGTGSDVVGTTGAGVGECVDTGTEGEPVSDTMLAALVSEAGAGILAGRVDVVCNAGVGVVEAVIETMFVVVIVTVRVPMVTAMALGTPEQILTASWESERS